MITAAEVKLRIFLILIINIWGLKKHPFPKKGGMNSSP
jgi:hypothetical protein